MPKKVNEKDYIGKRYGKLTVINADKFQGKNRLFECKCDCGNSFTRRMSDIKSGKYTMCDECDFKNTFNSIINKKVGKLFVTEKNRISPNPKVKAREFYCICDCGNEKWIQGGHLTTGNTKSCGCESGNKYGERDKTIKVSKILQSRRHDMIQRCLNPNNKAYKNYGGRGISICDDWLYNADSFYSWALNNGYNETLELDRIDVNGNYEPSNCRWITHRDNCNNRRITVYVEIEDGILVPMTVYCEKNNLAYTKYIQRYQNSIYFGTNIIPEEELIRDR